MVQLRRASVSDAIWLAELVTDPHFNRWMGDDVRKDELLALAIPKKFELYNAGVGNIMIAQDQSGPLGYGAYFDSRSTGHSYVEYGVSPSKCRRGTGGAILDALIGSAKRSGALGLQTLCHPENVASVKLLLSRGFAVSAALAYHPASFRRYMVSFAPTDIDNEPPYIEGIPPRIQS
ncbi:GNAT family N-acetyltransferase [Bradyrhizobium sp. SZCCHNR2032]|uniref:GNAT family N-acetyltransferase n=1 Tax=Bradyrhizobium sp. SZCCHNR2032 TaxID=3057384 RepID=UPI0029164087|nr:GNAT family N-acetyltransferase [Bradyrhizobium sp. SZCCHNR2032]